MGLLATACAALTTAWPGAIRCARSADCTLARPVPARLTRGSLWWVAHRRYLERGDLPARVEQRGGGGNKLVWAQDPTSLDLHVFLPVFLDGIRESDPDTRFMAVEGTFELLEQAGAQLTEMLGLLVKPLKGAWRPGVPVPRDRDVATPFAHKAH